ncbi:MULTISPECIES: carbohydrate-binding protein [Streptomyces]|uniref:CBM35 domain-containing protein n=1 Tax=Streptomyces plumbiresistens TaxID=511811 RepID=A0ABP7QEV2_9ACTN|nr:carbohydrate-binding protein [Streptomyces sp. NBC_01373]MCX4699833.1 carbohydrate-binding protein [Streptomyces sp. NBC_01373]
MTAGNNGASTPEDDDPFGYLYADGQANGAQPPSGAGGYGYPGSVNRVRAVGQRQYGQQAPAAATAPYGQVPQQSNAHYAAPETFPGSAPTTQQPQPSYNDGGGRRGPNTKGLLIGAIAVVAAVVIGIGVAMMGGDGDKDDAGGNGASTSPTTSQSSEPSPSSSQSAAAGELPKIDAKALRLDGGTAIASDVKGADAEGGVYVQGFNQVGAKVTWTVNGIEKAGDYRLYVRFGIPGVDANGTLTVNGKANTQPLSMKNFAGSPEGDWEKGWQTTWGLVSLTKGTNTIELSCQQGNQCNALLDQFSLTENRDQ